MTALREQAYDRLATAVRGHLRMDFVYAAMRLGQNTLNEWEDDRHGSTS